MSNLLKPLGNFKPSKSAVLMGVIVYLVGIVAFTMRNQICLKIKTIPADVVKKAIVQI
jgi:hypothetical protein